MSAKLKLSLVLALAAVLLLAAAALAQEKLLCVTKQQLKGEETVGSCLAKGERFAIVDQYGVVHVLTPEEVELTKAFNPKIFEQRAYGIPYYTLAPALPPLPLTKEGGP